MEPFPDKYPGCRLYLDIANQKKRAYKNDRPQGITVHYSASVHLSSTIKALEDRSLGYHLVIERDGSVVQLTRLGKAVAHAGKALWQNLSPNSTHLAVCLLSWGWVEPSGEDYKSWAGATVNAQDVAKSPNIIGGQTHWHLATKQQYGALVAICQWGMSHGITVNNICGHDEAALPPGRKLDPGGILGVSMEQFRQILSNIS